MSGVLALLSEKIVVFKLEFLNRILVILADCRLQLVEERRKRAERCDQKTFEEGQCFLEYSPCFLWLDGALARS